MKFIIGQKDIALQQKIKAAVLDIKPSAEIILCADWDCTVMDLIRSGKADFLILDINILGVRWQERVLELLQIRDKIRIILTAQHIDASILKMCFEAGLSGFISHTELDILGDILSIVNRFGVFVPNVIFSQASAPAAVAGQAGYRLPEGGTLTRRQIDVLRYLYEGLSNKQIAAKMNISEPTVKLHIHGLFHKLGATNRTQIVLKAQKLGFI